MVRGEVGAKNSLCIRFHTVLMHNSVSCGRLTKTSQAQAIASLHSTHACGSGPCGSTCRSKKCYEVISPHPCLLVNDYGSQFPQQKHHFCEEISDVHITLCSAPPTSDKGGIFWSFHFQYNQREAWELNYWAISLPAWICLAVAYSGSCASSKWGLVEFATATIQASSFSLDLSKSFCVSGSKNCPLHTSTSH